ncbi:hypothetical protein [Afifella pfennigii]|uniref:hypothetical protein n=1 Tax=Afifella pfennigii TaxID=209897 RepID=UPI00068BEE59|nr:hypothetical protein [Afifella pfennigii]
MIQNERIKLTANYFNGLAIAVLAIGGLAPPISLALDVSPERPVWSVALVSIVCLLGSAALHWLGRKVLAGLAA